MESTMTITCSVWSKTEAELSRCGWCSSHVYCSKFLKFNSRCDDDCEVSFHTDMKCQKRTGRHTRQGAGDRVTYIKLASTSSSPKTLGLLGLSCPATATFAAFHEALLVAFGWGLLFKITDLDTVDNDFDFVGCRRLPIGISPKLSSRW
jgi:hypothetical protein